MPRQHTLRLILWDQLNENHGWFKQPDKNVTYVLMDEGKPYGGQWNYDQKNPRVGMMYRVWDRMESREKKQVLKQADAYGNGHNEKLVGRAVANRRSETFIATKFGIVFDPDETGTDVPTGWGFSLNINGKPEYVQRALESSLERLGISHIDLWYAHYPDPATPIEETVSAMSEAVHAGKVRFLGLSNVTAEQIRRAHKIHPIAAVQYEYSLWRREVETELLPTLRELGIALIPWSPLGGGFLTGTIDAVGAEDFRNNNPRYQGDNLTANKQRFALLMKLAEELGITAAQLSLAWLLHQDENIIPIPGTGNRERVTENGQSRPVRIQTKLEKFSAGIVNTVEDEP